MISGGDRHFVFQTRALVSVEEAPHHAIHTGGTFALGLMDRYAMRRDCGRRGVYPEPVETNQNWTFGQKGQGYFAATIGVHWGVGGTSHPWGALTSMSDICGGGVTCQGGVTSSDK